MSKIIIEFNGLPGTGKTTITQRVKELLEREGIPVYICYKRHSKLLSLLYLFFDVNAWRVFIESLYFIKQQKSNNLIEKKRRVKMFVLFYEMYKDFLSNCNRGVLIMDQGIVQNVISSIHLDKKIDVDRLHNLLYAYKNAGVVFLRIDCNFDIESVSERIINRTHGESRVDLLDETERVKILIQQANLFKVVRDCFLVNYSICQPFSIDTKCSVEENTEKIVSIIKSHFV